MDETPKRRPSISQLSKTPSWVMLGFILGALCVWNLPKRETSAPRPIVIAPSPAPVRRAEPPQLTTIEAVFSQWADYAVWDHDLTQVVMWNSAVGEFAECYEVLRVDGTYYFRSLPHLTNRLIRHGKLPPPECPLRFTETEEQYRDWLQQGRFERPLEDVRPSVPVLPATPAPPRASGTEFHAVRPEVSAPNVNSEVRNAATGGGSGSASSSATSTPRK